MTDNNAALTSRKKVLLVDCDDRLTEQLGKSLKRLGMDTTTLPEGAQDIPADITSVIVEIDELQSRQLVEHARQTGLPIIALSKHETLSRIESAIAIGATAMLNRPVTQSSVYTTLMMAQGLRERINTLEAENAHQAQRLEQRPRLARAVAHLMLELGLNESDAYERIRLLSMKLNVSIEQICSDIERESLVKGVRN